MAGKSLTGPRAPPGHRRSRAHLRGAAAPSGDAGLHAPDHHRAATAIALSTSTTRHFGQSPSISSRLAFWESQCFRQSRTAGPRPPASSPRECPKRRQKPKCGARWPGTFRSPSSPPPSSPRCGRTSGNSSSNRKRQAEPSVTREVRVHRISEAGRDNADQDALDGSVPTSEPLDCALALDRQKGGR
jgi:hypothetical protein